MFNTLGGNRSGGGMSPIMVGLMGLLAYRTLKGKGRLADMLGTNQAGSGTGDMPTSGGSGGALGGGALGSGAPAPTKPSHRTSSSRRSARSAFSG
jgi:hypothetical protein